MNVECKVEKYEFGQNLNVCNMTNTEMSNMTNTEFKSVQQSDVGPGLPKNKKF